MNVVEALSLARHNYQFSWIHGNALVINNHPIHESGPPRQPSDFAGRRVFARSSLIAVDPVCVVHVVEKAGVPAEQYTSQYEGETPYFSLLIARKRLTEIASNTEATRYLRGRP